MLAPFSSSFKTDIKFDQRPGVYIALSRVIVFNFLSTLVLNFTVSFPRILNIDFISADRPEMLRSKGEYEIKKICLQSSSHLLQSQSRCE